MERFYWLKNITDGNSKKFADCDDILKHDQIELLQGKVQWPHPIFKAKKGFQKFDFLETSWPSTRLCSERVIKALTDHAMTGWSSTKVTVTEKGSGNPFTYYMLHVTKQSGPFNYSASEVISKEFGFVEMKGRYFDVNGAQGADIFFVEKTVMVFVSERFKELMEREQFTNVAFTANDEMVGSIPLSVYQAGLR